MNKVKVFLVGALLALSAVPASAAVTVDYTGTVTAVETQLTSALAAAMPLFGTILAIYVGIKLFKRFTKGA